MTATPNNAPLRPLSRVQCTCSGQHYIGSSQVLVPVTGSAVGGGGAATWNRTLEVGRVVRSPESVGRWLRVLVLAAWAGALLAVLWSVGYVVRAEREPGLVVLGLVSATCGWLLVVVRLFPDWRGRRRPSSDR